MAGGVVSGRLVVVGDALLDRDVEGAVSRIAPDAPVPVLDETSARERPGGAGLAALIAARGGAEVALVAAVADDDAGARLVALLAAAGVEVYPLPLAGATPEKIRLRAGGQTLLRLDRGGGAAPPGAPSDAALDVLADAGAILVSDYGRGVARESALRSTLAGASAPVVWDPHPRGPAAVPGARLATPNAAEVRALTGVAAVAEGARRLRTRWRAHAVAVTTGAAGATLCHAGPTPLVVPSPTAVHGPLDPCGAGDRFASAAALALAAGALVSEAVQAAVASASAYVAAGGPDSLAERSAASGEVSDAADPATNGRGRAAAVVARVRAAGGTVVATGGCFDLLHAGHVATLEAARRLGDCLVVCLNSDDSVARLKGPTRPVVGQADRARLLAALSCVDAVVVFDEPTPHGVLSWLRPDVWVKGGDYAEPPEAELVRRWGGETVVVPYLDGRSTTAMISKGAR
jgi:rfaE bifunctional protein nucleotidyltransferase chain/domain/rfaE bifunctional protein kinase chain/domain